MNAFTLLLTERVTNPRTHVKKIPYIDQVGLPSQQWLLVSGEYNSLLCESNFMLFIIILADNDNHLDKRLLSWSSDILIRYVYLVFRHSSSVGSIGGFYLPRSTLGDQYNGLQSIFHLSQLYNGWAAAMSSVTISQQQNISHTFYLNKCCMSITRLYQSFILAQYGLYWISSD